MIVNNIKKRNEINTCKNCMEDIIKKVIDPVYLYIDCNGDNFVNAEDIWTSLKGLERKEGDGLYNIYQCVIDGTEVRTVSINDFILKSQKSLPGKLSRDEWRVGILVGYLGRQIKDDKIFVDLAANAQKGPSYLDANNLKNLRWRDNGKVDISCDYMRLNK
jgi:hypothetical protein